MFDGKHALVRNRRGAWHLCHARHVPRMPTRWRFNALSPWRAAACHSIPSDDGRLSTLQVSVVTTSRLISVSSWMSRNRLRPKNSQNDRNLKSSPVTLSLLRNSHFEIRIDKWMSLLFWKFSASQQILFPRFRKYDFSNVERVSYISKYRHK